jgi:hypothetical protein
MIDDTMEGRQRRLDAVRSAIRYRNPETGKRSHLHAAIFRAAAGAYVRQLRALVKESN